MFSEGLPYDGALSNHRWKVLAVGVATNIIFYAAFSGIPMTAVLMRATYRLTNAELGLVFGLFSAGLAVSEVPWGLLADYWGEREALRFGLTAATAVLCAMAVFLVPRCSHLPRVGYLWLASFLFGFFGGSVNGASGRAVMAWFGESERGFAMSVRQAALPVGAALGTLILPAAAATAGFRVLFGLLATLTAIAALLASLYLHAPASLSKAAQVGSDGLYITTRAPLWKNRQVWRIAIAIALLCAAQCSILTFAALFLHDVGHVETMASSVTVVVIQAGSTIMRILAGRSSDKKQNRRQYLRRACLLCVGAFLCLALINGGAVGLTGPQAFRGVLVFAFIVTGVCVSAWHGVAYVELASHSSAQRIATALGLGNTFAFIGMFFCTVAVPALLAHWGWPSVWLLAGGCALAGFFSFPPPPVKAGVHPQPQGVRPAAAVAGSQQEGLITRPFALDTCSRITLPAENRPSRARK